MGKTIFHDMLMAAQCDVSKDRILNWDINCSTDAVEIPRDEFYFGGAAKVLAAIERQMLRAGGNADCYSEITIGGIRLHAQKRIERHTEIGMEFQFYLAAANGTWHAMIRYSTDDRLAHEPHNLEKVKLGFMDVYPLSVHAVAHIDFLRDLIFLFMAANGPDDDQPDDSGVLYD